MISYLYLIITVLLLFTAGIFLSILIYHFKDLIYNKKFKNKKENWEEVFFEFLNKEITLNEAVEYFPRKYNYLYDFFKPYLKNIKGEDFFRIKELIKELEMDKYYLKRLKNGRRKKKVKASVFLGIIGKKKAIPYFKEYIYKDDDLRSRIMASSRSDYRTQDLKAGAKIQEAHPDGVIPASARVCPDYAPE